MEPLETMPLFGHVRSPERPGATTGRRLLRRLAAGLMQIVRQDAGGRSRGMRLDPLRLAVAVASTAAVAATAAWAWTWQQHQRQADTSAQAALRFVDRRLGAIDLELTQVLRSAQPSALPTSCPDALVSMLLQQSLQSTLVRRFDLVQLGSSMRCEPGGERAGTPLEEMPSAGLSIVPGSPMSPRPIVLRAWSSTVALQATLDPYALALPRTELPPELQTVPLRIVAQSPPAGALPIWDSRPHPGSTGPAIVSTAMSASHNLGVSVQVDQGDLDAAIRRHALFAGAIALLTLAFGVRWVWVRALRRARLSNRLTRALRKRQFVPYVQPIIDLSSGRCAGAEVLMRWAHPQRGVLAPAEFIEEAERTGLIVGMSELVMARAAHQLAPLVAARPDLYFSFNVTPLQLRQTGFARRLDEIFGHDTLAREHVLLELTEREFVDDQTGRSLATLKAQGWRIAVDDFGTGHSSLAALEGLAIDRIKIDRAFVRTIDEGTVSRPVLDAIIALAAELRVPLIAEGVETRSQWDYLAARGVGHAQGYLMARPMPIEAFTAWLAERGEAPRQTSTVAAAATGPTSDTQVQALWHDMRQSGGLDVRDRMHRLQTYRQCFVGREAVDWIVQRLGVRREEAVRIGQRLAATDRIRHVRDEHDFEDADLFFRFVQPAAADADSAPASDELRQALRGPHGVHLTEHTRGLLCFRASVTGRDIVNWIVRRYRVTRPTACQWAAQQMRAGTLRHVFDDQPFRDDRTLYQMA